MAHHSTRHASFADPLHPMRDFVVQMAAEQRKLGIPAKCYSYSFLDGGNRSKGSKNPGWIYVPPTIAARDKMLAVYSDAIDADKPVFVSESTFVCDNSGDASWNSPEAKSRCPRRMFADFDVTSSPARSREWYIHVATVWIAAVRECFPECDSRAFMTCGLLRTPELVDVTTNNRIVRMHKGGMHLVMPSLIVDEDGARCIREVALMRLYEDMPIESGDTPWEDVYDPKFDSLRMLGSGKASRCKTCKGKARKEEVCDACGGMGFKFSKAAYRLDMVFNGDGIINEAAHSRLAGDTLAQVRLTHVSVVDQECTPGLELPLGFDAAEICRAAKSKTKAAKNAKRLNPDNPIVAFLEGAVRRISPHFADVRVREVQSVKVGRDVVKYIINPWQGNMLPCLNLVNACPHRSVGIFFEVCRKDGHVVQRCKCKCDKGIDQGRVSGKCSDAKMHGQFHVRLSPQRMLEMFDFRPRELQMWMEAALDVRSGSDSSWHRDEFAYLNAVHISVFGSPFNALSVPADSAISNAMRAYMLVKNTKSSSIIAREQMRADFQRQFVATTNELLKEATAPGVLSRARANATSTAINRLSNLSEFVRQVAIEPEDHDMGTRGGAVEGASNVHDGLRVEAGAVHGSRYRITWPRGASAMEEVTVVCMPAQ